MPIDLSLLKRVFLPGCWSGKLSPNIIDSFHTILRSESINSPTDILLPWLYEAKERASQELDGADVSFLEIDLQPTGHFLEIVDAYQALWDMTCSLSEPELMVSVRLCMTESLGFDRQRELIGMWNAR